MNRKKDITEIIVFCGSIIIVLLATVLQYGNIVLESPDGNLYLSIADNFLKTGHFIQTSRPHEVGMVVPPGVPFLFCLMKLIVNNVLFIVVVQYAIFGITMVMLYRLTINISESKFVGVLTVGIYIMTLAGDFSLSASPSYTTTETYAMAILVFCGYIATEIYKKRIDSKRGAFILIGAAFFGWLTRPVLLMLFAPIGLYCLFLLFKKKIVFKQLLVCGVIGICILSLNGLINYRETGNFILMENYSALPLYQANNSNTKTYSYASSLCDEFVDEKFYDIYLDESLTCTEKNKLYKKDTIDYVLHNGGVLQNTFSKFLNMFVHDWTKSFELMMLSIIIILLLYPEKRILVFLFTITYFLIAASTSFGLYIHRYSLIALPFYALFKAVLLKEVFTIMKRVKENVWK